MTGATDTNIRPSSRVARGEAIIFTELDDTVVMMDVEEGRYYELDPVGARVWDLIESGPRIAEVCEALVAEYDVSPETCRDDVAAFLGRLNHLGVVQILQPDEAREHDSTDSEAETAARSGWSGDAEGAERP